MLTQLFPLRDTTYAAPGEARRLSAPAEDCDRLAHRRSIAPTPLRSAPLLEDRVPAITPAGVRLIEYASGHPVHSHHMAMTTALWWADPDGAWVRPLPRFYRFGEPAHPDDASRLVPLIATCSGAVNDDSSEDGA
jgi:hypothetical protein